MSLVQRSAKFISIVRKQPEYQVVFLSVELLPELSEKLQNAISDALDREDDPNLPDTVCRIAKFQLRVNTFKDTGNVRVDFRLWFTNTDGEEKATTRGVNINVEQAEILKDLIDNFLAGKKDHVEEEESIQLPQPTKKGKKSTPIKQGKTPAPKKAKAQPSQAKKNPKKIQVVDESTSDEESD